MEIKVTGETKLLAFLSEFARRLNEGEDFEKTISDIARKIDQMYRVEGKELVNNMKELENRMKILNEKFIEIKNEIKNKKI